MTWQSRWLLSWITVGGESTHAAICKTPDAWAQQNQRPLARLSKNSAPLRSTFTLLIVLPRKKFLPLYSPSVGLPILHGLRPVDHTLHLQLRGYQCSYWDGLGYWSYQWVLDWSPSILPAWGFFQVSLYDISVRFGNVFTRVPLYLFFSGVQRLEPNVPPRVYECLF